MSNFTATLSGALSGAGAMGQGGPRPARAKLQRMVMSVTWDASFTDHTLIMSRSCRCCYFQLKVDPVEVLSNGLRLQGFEQYQYTMTIKKQAL